MTLQALGIDDSVVGAPVTIRVTYDDSNQELEASTTLTIINTAPTATLTNDGPVAEGSDGSSVQVTFGSPSDPSDADTAAGFSYDLDFDDDGTFDLEDVATPTVFVPAEYLTDDGTITVRGVISDVDGGSTELTTEITITPVDPTIDLSGGAATSTEGQTYSLPFVVTDPGDDTITQFTINWGDGSGLETFSDVSQPLEHVFKDDGPTTTITVTAIDEDGSYEVTKVIDVTNVDPTLSNIAATATSGSGRNQRR